MVKSAYWGEISCPQQNKPDDWFTLKWNFCMKKMILEKYLQICEGVSILIDIPLFMLTVMKKHGNSQQKNGQKTWIRQ